MFTVNFNLVPSKKINILFAVLLIWGNQQVFSQTTQLYDIVVYFDRANEQNRRTNNRRIGTDRYWEQAGYWWNIQRVLSEYKKLLPKTRELELAKAGDVSRWRTNNFCSE